MGEIIGVDVENLRIDLRLTVEEADRVVGLLEADAAALLRGARTTGSKLLEGTAEMRGVEWWLGQAGLVRGLADLLTDALDEHFPEDHEPPSYEDEGPHGDHLGPQDWTTLGTLAINAATMGFADPRAVPLAQQGERLVWSGSAADPGHVGPWPVVAMCTVEDQDVPIEVVHDAERAVVAVRLELVNDIAHLGGRWKEVAAIDLPDGEVSVCDPYCAWQTIDVRPGRWAFEVFESDRDGLLAARIVHPSLTAAAGWDGVAGGDGRA